MIATSFEMSPVVLFAFAALEDAALPKNDIVEVFKIFRAKAGGGHWLTESIVTFGNLTAFKDGWHEVFMYFARHL